VFLHWNGDGGTSMYVLVIGLVRVFGSNEWCRRFARAARWLPPMVFSTLLLLAADPAHKRLRPEAPAATPASTARG
jgi:hypothetical protein